jgi:hypothetical protein
MHSTINLDVLTRSELWSGTLKEALKDELQAQKWVKLLNGFPDGTTFTIPSIGDLPVRNYTEDTGVTYDSMDTGEFQFTISEYVSSATYITAKARQDVYYASQLEASFLPKQLRAIMEKYETDVLALGAGGASGGQTVSAQNQINGVDHRFTATGSSAVITVADFAKARYSLKKANVPDRNLIAIVDPSVEYTLNTLSNLVNVSNNPRWEGIVSSGIASGMSFIKNVYGFDVYTSNYLPVAGTTGSETVNSVAVSNGVCNLFFSATSDILPFVGAWRQMPKVDGEWNKDFQREEYVTTARYGLKVYRPENLVVVLSTKSV